MLETYKPTVCPDIFVNHDSKDEGLVIEASLPGVTRDDISLTVGNSSFCVSGERDDVKYDGCFQLAHEVNSKKAKAKFENGLLKVNIPFKEPLHGIKIKID